MLSWTFMAAWATLGSFCKTPPLFLKFGKYVIYMTLNPNVKKRPMYSVKISLQEELKAVGLVEQG